MNLWTVIVFVMPAVKYRASMMFVLQSEYRLSTPPVNIVTLTQNKLNTRAST